MAITQAKKQEISKRLSDALGNSETSVFVSFKALPVEKNNTLRKQLIANDSNYFVAKKSLIKRAMNALSVTGTAPDLGDGMVAIAFGNDQMAPAREVYEFSKGMPQVEILGGIFDGAFQSREEMMTIATIPGMDALRGMFANVINSPVQRFAIALDQVAQKQA